MTGFELTILAENTLVTLVVVIVAVFLIKHWH
jgi:hypothetical protein